METSEDKQWASKYLLDPLTAPEPCQESGPGSRYGSTFAPRPASKQADTDSKRSSETAVSVRPLSNHRREALMTGHQRSSSLGRPSTEIPTSSARPSLESGRHRGSSLGARYAGDESHRPLDIIRRDSKKANRAPHLRKKSHIGVDHIDRLDAVGYDAYHHGSAYDAVSLARNQNPRDSPVRALARTNSEALRATPRERVTDSIKRHRPIDGVAMTPPGHVGPNGRVMRYQEGTDMMIENGGNYKRWPGLDYHPDDLKGKGEPSFSIERALKDNKHQMHGRHASDGVELVDRPFQHRSDGASDALMGSATRNARDGSMQSDDAAVARTNSASGQSRLQSDQGNLRRRRGNDA